jgi:hypothetical protein
MINGIDTTSIVRMTGRNNQKKMSRRFGRLNCKKNELEQSPNKVWFFFFSGDLHSKSPEKKKNKYCWAVNHALGVVRRPPIVPIRQ